ncbi:MAG: protein translocase subunit SecF, partial [Chitinispirillaceae bacterium]
MHFFNNTKWNILGYRKFAIGLSLAMILATAVSIIAHRGLNLSIDFAGGTTILMKFDKPVLDDLPKVREAVEALGYGQPEIKTIGSAENREIQITVRSQAATADLTQKVRNTLATTLSGNEFQVLNTEQVGPKIGGELKRDAIIATILALIAILFYVGIRFHLPFGVAAVVPLFHDVLITLGIFSLLNLEISLPFLAAILTVVGYSLNDTIVIFDRIRENLKGGLKGRSFVDVINGSINQTISRTIITSLTTLFVVATLYILGSNSIKDFALALLVGVIVGTYSSLFVASPVLIWWH